MGGLAILVVIAFVFITAVNKNSLCGDGNAGGELTCAGIDAALIVGGAFLGGMFGACVLRNGN